MNISVPVTDYIRASLLTTLHDIVIRGAANPERIPEVDWRGVYIGNNTMNAGGDQVINTVPFRPRCLIFLANDDRAGNQLNWSVGFSDGTANVCLCSHTLGVSVERFMAHSMFVQSAVANYLVGAVSAISDVGFTITWTLLGVMAVDYTYLCIP